jgi:membrane-bound acyltransferase YfiQ involved in biofilm formation
VSAFLWTRSWFSQTPSKFFLRRVVELLQPYLLWSLIYGLGTGRWFRTDGEFLWSNFWHDLLNGRAHYHLYFMVILAQLVVAAPILGELFRRLRTPWWLMLIITVAFFLASRFFLTFGNPKPVAGSFLLSYSLTMVPFVWLAVQPVGAVTNREKRSIVYATALLSPVAFLLAARFPEAQIFGSVYSASMTLFIVGCAFLMPIRDSIGAGLAVIGRNSLPLYLLHPAILVLFGALGSSPLSDRSPVQALSVWILTVGVSMLFSLAIRSSGLGVVLLGPRYARQNPVH